MKYKTMHIFCKLKVCCKLYSYIVIGSIQKRIKQFNDCQHWGIKHADIRRFINIGLLAYWYQRRGSVSQYAVTKNLIVA